MADDPEEPLADDEPAGDGDGASAEDDAGVDDGGEGEPAFSRADEAEADAEGEDEEEADAEDRDEEEADAEGQDDDEPDAEDRDDQESAVAESDDGGDGGLDEPEADADERAAAPGADTGVQAETPDADTVAEVDSADGDTEAEADSPDGDDAAVQQAIEEAATATEFQGTAEADEDGEEADEADDGPKTCAGTTQAGEPCGRRVSAENDYCYLHQDQAEGWYEPPEIEPGADFETAGYEPRRGPAEDEEMPLADHIEEMLKRLAVVIAVAGVVSLVTFPFADQLINALWNSILPEGELTRPRLYGILELKLTELKVASLVGLIVALPVLVYQTYQFMKPGLYPHERRYYLAAIPTSLVLALVGVAFAHFVVLPALFTYFLYYSQDVATIGFALGRTFDLILLLMGYLAIVFQIPLFIMLAMMMGLVTRRWLAQRRLLFWGAFLGISFIFSPDPTGMAPIVVALTMVGLFEGTLLLTKWTRRGRAMAGERSVQQ